MLLIIAGALHNKAVDRAPFLSIRESPELDPALASRGTSRSRRTVRARARKRSEECALSAWHAIAASSFAACIALATACGTRSDVPTAVAAIPSSKPALSRANESSPANKSAADESSRANESARAGGDARPQSSGKKRAIEARLEFPTARGAEARPQALLALDLDGDGRDELITATMAPGSLQIWSGLSPELRAAPEPRAFPIEDYPIGPVWVGGRRPRTNAEPALVAIASRTALELSVVDVRAAFASTPGKALETAWRMKLDRRPRVIASGALAGDDRPTIAIVTIDDDLVLARGATDARHMRLSDDHATCARFLDDHGGIVFGFQGTRRIVIYVKSAMSADVNPIGLEPGPSTLLPGLPRALDEVDLDGDGDSELVVAGGDKSLWVFGLGRAGGWKTWFDAPPLEIETSIVPIDVAHADFDRDGKMDLLSLGLYGQEVRLHSGASFAAERATHDGTKIDRAWRAYAGQQPGWTTIGDFDGDGALDVAIANPGARRASVLFGDGRGGVRTAEIAPAGRSPNSIASGDFDGDGDLDVAGINALEGSISIFENQNGTLAPGRVVANVDTADALRAADLDGDGKLDLAYLQAPNNVCTLVALYGDGHGGFAARADSKPLEIGVSLGDLLIGDLFGDGGLEALAADPQKDQVALVVIDRKKGASPTFEPPRKFPIERGPCALALVPNRRGGAPTIAVACSGPNERGLEFLRFAPGADHAPAATRIARIATKEFPRKIAVADLDGDGELDLAVLATEVGDANRDSPGFIVPWLQASDGSWRALDPLPTGARPYGVAAGDLDGDGKMEIIVSAQNSHHLNLWRARAGSPLGYERCADLGAGTGPLGLLLVDLDHDGVPEIVTANTFSNELSVIHLR
jgi:hypothetical protein